MNEKKESAIEKFGLQRGVARKCLLDRGGVLIFITGVGNVLKKKELDKRRVEEKIEGLPLPQSDYGLYAMYCTY